MYEIARDKPFEYEVLLTKTGELHTLSFRNELAMFKFMDQLRLTSTNECVGCVDTVGSQHVFRYKLTEDLLMSRFLDFGQKSWHSHPNIPAEELASMGGLEESDMRGLSYLQRVVTKILEETFAAAEIPSARKPSIMDLIYYIYHQRVADLISMPPAHILELTRRPTDQQLPIDSLHRQFRLIGLTYGVSGLASKAVSPLFKELGDINTMMYYAALAKALHKEIRRSGYEKLTEDNFLNVVSALGFDFRYISMVTTAHDSYEVPKFNP